MNAPEADVRSTEGPDLSKDSHPHGDTKGARATASLLAMAATVVGAVCVAGASVIHLHLWMTGYRHIPTIGPLFLLQAIGGFVLAVVIAVWHRWYVVATGALFLLSTAGGLIISTHFSLFGFRDSFGAPYAGMALVLEGMGAAVLLTAAGAQVARRRAAVDVIGVANGEWRRQQAGIG